MTPGDAALLAQHAAPPGGGPAAPQIERFRAQVARHLGLRFEDDKRGWLGEVLGRRMEAMSLDGEAYLAQLEAHAPAGTGTPDLRRELAALAHELTVTETYFFRNREQFLALQEHVVPQRLAAWPGRRSLRILSAGCASGEEPYSIAMTLHALRDNPAHEVSIQAVDLNPQMIQKARTGRYTAWSLRDTPAALQQRWFRPQGQELVLDEAVRAAVDFQERNLSLEDELFWQPGLYDVVFCRNVLMYFTPPAAQAAMARITRSLAPGGYLFLGHAETLRGLSPDYELCHTHGTFYYQRNPVLRLAAAEPVRPVVPAMPPAPPPADPAQPGTWFQDIGLAAERIRVLTAAPDTATLDDTCPATPDDDVLAPALALLRHERYAQALALVQGLPAAAARQPDALLLQSVLLAHGGRLDAAEQVCHQLLALHAAHAGAHYVLALCREGAGDLAGAAGHDHAAITLDPAFAMPRLHLGLLARRRGDWAAVRRELGHALALLAREDAARLLLFGGGFQREALLALCRAGLQACEASS
jgi:chemotaxis protein methyltransferase CheR